MVILGPALSGCARNGPHQWKFNREAKTLSGSPTLKNGRLNSCRSDYYPFLVANFNFRTYIYKGLVEPATHLPVKTTPIPLNLNSITSRNLWSSIGAVRQTRLQECESLVSCGQAHTTVVVVPADSENMRGR